MRRKGLSLISIVIYVALFFAFMTFATIISTNMNYTSLSYKGQVINVENFEKLQYNMLNSAKSSISVDKIGESIVFSNEDEYVYDSGEKKILKNDSVLVSNVISFDVVNIDELDNVPDSFFQKENDEYINIDNSKQYVCINITFEKYGVQTTSQLFVTVGDDVNG